MKLSHIKGKYETKTLNLRVSLPHTYKISNYHKHLEHVFGGAENHCKLLIKSTVQIKCSVSLDRIKSSINMYEPVMGNFIS